MANAVITGVIANGVNSFLRPIFWCTHPHPSRNLLTSSPTLSSKYFILFIIIFFLASLVIGCHLEGNRFHGCRGMKGR